MGQLIEGSNPSLSAIKNIVHLDDIFYVRDCGSNPRRQLAGATQGSAQRTKRKKARSIFLSERTKEALADIPSDVHLGVIFNGGVLTSRLYAS